MRIFCGGSVWAVPSASTLEFSELQGIIRSNSQKFKSPSFTPHITLASLPQTLDLNKIAISFREVITQMVLNPIQLDCIQQGDTFYQSVFAKVNEISTSDLQNIQDKLYQSLDTSPPKDLPHFAHLSLYYGTDPDAKASVTDAASKMKVLTESTRVFLSSLWLADCTDAVEDWRILLRIDAEVKEE
jgi:2',3'-cyclic-nucleotide 3'-phosphodiesterase